MARRAVRLGDLASPDTLAEKLAAMVAHRNVWLGLLDMHWPMPTRCLPI